MTDNTVKNIKLPDGQVLNVAGGGGLEICDIGMSLYVDETKGLRRRLNGQIVDINTNTQAFLTRLQSIIALYPSLSCTEEEWQAAKTLSAFGQVGKFVLNYAEDGVTVESVRLPAVVNVQGVLDLSNLGMTVGAGLPNITGSIPQQGHNASTGCFFTKNSRVTMAGASWITGDYISLDASRSNSIYGSSNTVQQESIVYPYFIQINTGQETKNNIVNDIELNNPFTLLESKYSPDELHNASWLASKGQWNPKAIYVTVYEGLVVEHNTEIAVGTTVTLPSGTNYTKRGLSMKLSTDSDITDYDFVINTEDETFRLPLLDGSEMLPSNEVQELGDISSFTAPVNGYLSVRAASTAAWGWYDISLSDRYPGGSNPVNNTNGSVKTTVYIPRGITASIKSGSVKDKETKFTPAKGNGTLYFYVGDTEQNANLIDVGRILESLSKKVDIDNQKTDIVESYHNSTSGYVVYSNGLCLQWGRSNCNVNNSASVKLLKPFKDNTYSITTGFAYTGYYCACAAYNYNATSFSLRIYRITGSEGGTWPISWTVIGYVNLEKGD